MHPETAEEAPVLRVTLSGEACRSWTALGPCTRKGRSSNGRRLPEAILEMVTPTRRRRVLGFRRVDPAQPFPARHWRDVVPYIADLPRRARQGVRQIGWHRWFRPVRAHRDRDVCVLADVQASGSSLFFADPDPVAFGTIWFHHGLELVTVERPYDGYLPA